MVAGRQRTYYPAFRDKVHNLRRYLDRYKRDMIEACQIDGEHLEQLEALAKALETIDYHWPPYRRTY
jgi:hypothetical protein